MTRAKKLGISLTALLLLVCMLLGSCSLFGGEGQIINLEDVPEYSGDAYVEINGNVPFFEENEITADAFESYAELDELGRCGTAFACIGREIMPDDDEERESISSVTPSGWKTESGKSNNNVYADLIDNGGYIYNRCHLIGYQLAGENANEKNLITGTRYLNIEGMLPFENLIDDYVEETGNHVLYRVTPIYDGYNLVASGVLMEGYSVEDSGEDISFCVFAYNIQPGIEINYSDGSNYRSGETPDISEEEEAPDENSGEVNYILNTSNKKYHLPTCSSVTQMKEENKGEYCGAKEAFLTDYPNYTPCGSCKPDEN